jgi:hypothetical protein
LGTERCTPVELEASVIVTLFDRVEAAKANADSQCVDNSTYYGMIDTYTSIKFVNVDDSCKIEDNYCGDVASGEWYSIWCSVDAGSLAEFDFTEFESTCELDYDQFATLYSGIERDFNNEVYDFDSISEFNE